MTSSVTHKSVFRVIDAYDHPHGGRILRLRLRSGQAPGLRELKGSRMAASGGGEDVTVKVGAFALGGGKPSGKRLARTGRVDIHVAGPEGGAVRAGWELAGPL